jgi:DNA-binding transcriptional MerR regulator
MDRHMGSSVPRDLCSTSELAVERGITPRAIRGCERQELRSPRRAGAHPVPDRRDRARLRRIPRGRRPGFRLDGIAEYPRFYSTPRLAPGWRRCTY